MMLRMVRNMPMERYALGHPEPFAPLYDVERVDGAGFPLAVVAVGVGAEKAKALMGEAISHER